jgi:hypothetical protein
MRPVLQNQPQIGGLSQALLDSLRNMLAGITAGWNKQHDGDGAHTAVTADSVTVSGTTVLGKLRLNSVTWYDNGTTPQNNVTVAGLADASWLRIVPNQGAGVDLEITGIDATGREVGDLLLVTNCGSEGAGANDIALLLEDALSIAANRFNHGRGVWLVYDYDTTGGFAGPRVPRWRIIDQT